LQYLSLTDSPFCSHHTLAGADILMTGVGATCGTNSLNKKANGNYDFDGKFCKDCGRVEHTG